uniref:ATP-binding protein n=1 Tax=Rheinheimera sp. TaxID=1869214 RepID=UPI0040487E43
MLDIKFLETNQPLILVSLPDRNALSCLMVAAHSSAYYFGFSTPSGSSLNRSVLWTKFRGLTLSLIPELLDFTYFRLNTHNILMIGPPGSGKSMIAKRVPSIMPSPTQDESLEILSVQSVAAPAAHSLSLNFGLRPVRSPHHTISDVGLLGGGTIPGPGEVSLAHHGVLFLDELPEFKRSALEVLRQPLEDGVVTISRSAGKITLPCAFMLVAAMNPCPCGF